MASAWMLPVSRPRLLSRLLSPLLSRLPAATMASSRPRSFSSYLVSPSELHEALQKSPEQCTCNSTTDTRVVPLCASWFMPNDPRSGLASFRELRIPRARFFDLEAVSDHRSEYPHMLPSPKTFAEAMSGLGIRREDTVVVYDSHETGIFSAPRVGWTLRVFGHPKVHLLNNFKLWVEQGLPTETGEFYSIECCQYPIPELDENRVASFDEVKHVAKLNKDQSKQDNEARSKGENVQILDARSHGRWLGSDPEPRKGLPSGHMPGSINIPYGDVLDPKTKAFLPSEKLRQLFEDKGVDPASPVIASCGTGVSACVIETALEAAGYGQPGTRRVYDGSWT